jgi:hypothetical protein
MKRERNDSVLGKTLLARVLAVTATTLVAAGITAASPALAAPAAQQTGIPNFLPSAIQINKAAHTATLPLFRGSAPGLGRVWFILTDTSNLADAERLGINWAPKLVNELLRRGQLQRAARADPRPGRVPAQPGLACRPGRLDGL